MMQWIPSIQLVCSEAAFRDWPLVAAIVKKESRGDPWAVRYEPGFFDRYIKDLSRAEVERLAPGVKSGLPSLDTEKRMMATSFGLMQIMGVVAREQGFRGRYLTQLCEPHTGLLYGVRHLQTKIKDNPDLPSAVAAYNAGSARRKKGSRVFVNQDYVDEVMKYYAEYRSL